MNNEEFIRIVENQKEDCYATLIKKEKEYSDGKDRLVQFRNVAAMRGVHPLEALGGMMAKHTSSIYQLINDVRDDMLPTMEIWNEKITDHINYLFLLIALVLDTGSYRVITEDSGDLTELGQKLRAGHGASKDLEGYNPYEDDKPDTSQD